jgi:hypothetical protein
MWHFSQFGGWTIAYPEAPAGPTVNEFIAAVPPVKIPPTGRLDPHKLSFFFVGE